LRKLLGRSDYTIISELVETGSKVLDLGCGDGALLGWLAANKNVEGRGLEIDGAKVQSQGSEGYCPGGFRLPGRHRLRPGRLPRPGIRLRHPEPDVAGDPSAIEGAQRNLADRPPRGGGFSEFRSLAGAVVTPGERPGAAHNWTVERRIFLTAHRQVSALANLLAEIAVFQIRK